MTSEIKIIKFIVLTCDIDRDVQSLVE